MIDPAEIRRRIEGILPDATVQVRDLTGGGDHYQVEVVSPRFAGMSALARHRLVYAPFKDVLEGGSLHAFTISTQTPDEAKSARS